MGQKPFDIEAAKRGESLVTRYGEPATFVGHFPSNRPNSRIAYVVDGELCSGDETGKFYATARSHRLDVFMRRRTIALWMNLHPRLSGGYFVAAFDSQAEADKHAEDRIGPAVRVEFEV